MLHLEGFDKQVRFTGKARCVMILPECAHTSDQFRGVYCRARARCGLWGCALHNGGAPPMGTNSSPETVSTGGAPRIFPRNLFPLLLAATKNGAWALGRNGIGRSRNRFGGAI